MNPYLLASGILALFIVIGHFAVGSKMYLKPMLEAEFDKVAAKVMHSAFHYVSVFLVLSSAALILAGAGVDIGIGASGSARFIGIAFAGFALTQLLISLTSGIERGPLKMFQWMLFVPVSVLAILGSCCCGACA